MWSRIVFAEQCSSYFPSPGFGSKEYSLPPGANLSQVHVLHRHGSRYPTSDSAVPSFGSKLENLTKSAVAQWTGPLNFINEVSRETSGDFLRQIGDHLCVRQCTERRPGHRDLAATDARTDDHVWRRGHPRFTGSPPSDAQIYGNFKYSDYYYNLSATTYQYLAFKYGAPAAFHAALIAYLGGDDGPFAGILQSSSHGTVTYYNPDQIRAAWAAYYVKTYGR